VPAEVAPDGSPVEIYRRLPPGGEAELIHGGVAPGASILELGCGAGRVTHELLRLGQQALREAGLQFVRWLDDRGSWSEARPCENRAA
jgi:hypothetical protein